MINNSVKKCVICNNEKCGEFITINDNKYHLCCIEELQNNWNELKKWLEEFQEDICYDTGGEYFCKDENMEVKVQVVLDKMQELEGNNDKR